MSEEGMNDESKFRTIIKTRVGSHCHGVNMPESDDDIRSVFIPTKDYFLGLKTCEIIQDKVDGNDIEKWNVAKLFRLCIKGNPSALNVLFAVKKDQLYRDEWGQKIFDIRDKFLSKRSVTAIVGYCKSQIHKLNIGRGTKTGKRSTMIEKYGYDVKFCYQAVMLTNMGIEMVKDQGYHPMRKDNEQQYLRAVRRGKIDIEDIRHTIQENLKTIKMLEPSCSLSDRPDEEWLNEWITNYLWSYYES